MLQIILNLTQRPCLPQYINRCCRQTLTSLSFWPIGVWKCLSSIKMQAINYESRATRSYSSSSVTLCVVRFESDLTFSFRPFASDLRRRNLSKKETNKLEFAYEHIFLLKNYYYRLSALQVFTGFHSFFNRSNVHHRIVIMIVAKRIFMLDINVRLTFSGEARS